MTDVKSMDKIMALCKRRGFVYQASEIYGGINGFWDYGPLGAQLKKNLRDAWWEDMVMTGCRGATGPDGNPVRILPLDSCIIQNPKVWEASGHVGGFNDPRVDCKKCKARFRADHLWTVRFGEATKSGSGSLEFLEGQTVNIAVLADSKDDAEQRVWRLGERLAKKLNIKTTTKTAYAGLDLPIEEYACAECGEIGSLTPPRLFNLMFPTVIGATGDPEADKAYLRPETAQGIFINFKNVVDTSRVKLPFGIAQTGKAFRNEVTPRNFTFRSREFEQMEVEFFCHEDDATMWYEFWRDYRMNWWKALGLAGENLTLREHDQDEMAHYSTATSDVEYRFPFTSPGYGELEGIAHRGNYDLTQHQQHSGQKLEYFDSTRGELAKNGQPKGERYLPHVIEPSAGLDRGVLAALCEAYTVDESRPSPEIMKLHPRLAPIKAAVFPLVNKGGMPEVAAKLHRDLTNRFARVGFIETDAKQSIGKRYARMDEAGCPYCFTIDGETVDSESANHNTVTARDRDTGEQERISLDKVVTFLSAKLGV